MVVREERSWYKRRATIVRRRRRLVSTGLIAAARRLPLYQGGNRPVRRVSPDQYGATTAGVFTVFVGRKHDRILRTPRSGTRFGGDCAPASEAQRHGRSLPDPPYPGSDGFWHRHACDEDTVIAGILHDVIEDAPADDAQLKEALATTFHELDANRDASQTLEALLPQLIVNRFGPRVLELVSSVSERKTDAAGKKRPWRDRKEEQFGQTGGRCRQDVRLEGRRLDSQPPFDAARREIARTGRLQTIQQRRAGPALVLCGGRAAYPRATGRAELAGGRTLQDVRRILRRDLCVGGGQSRRRASGDRRRSLPALLLGPCDRTAAP